MRVSGLAAGGFVLEALVWVCQDRVREDHLDAYRQIPFRIDTGSTHTTMGMDLARENHIVLPRRRGRVTTRTASGLRTELTAEGSILAKFVGLEAYPFVIPCVFVEDRPAELPGLLGLNALQPRLGPYLRATFDGSPQPEMPDGHVVIDLIPRPA
jgi:hypothetical protein